MIAVSFSWLYYQLRREWNLLFISLWNHRNLCFSIPLSICVYCFAILSAPGNFRFNLTFMSVNRMFMPIMFFFLLGYDFVDIAFFLCLHWKSLHKWKISESITRNWFPLQCALKKNLFFSSGNWSRKTLRDANTIFDARAFFVFACRSEILLGTQK